MPRGERDQPDPSFEEKVAVARAGYDAFNRGEVEEVLAIFDPDISWRRRPVHPVQETYRGREEVASNVLGAIKDQFSELTLEPIEFFDHGDDLVVRVRQRGVGRSSGAIVEGEIVQVLAVRNRLLAGLRTFSTMEEALAALPSS